MKRNKFFIAFIAAMFMLAITVRAEEQKREVSGFNKVSFAIPANLEISQGNSEGLVLIGNSEDLEKIVTKVEDGNLKIYKKNNSGKIGEVKIQLAVKNLKELAIAGSGDVVFMTAFTSDDFELSVSGSGNVKCKEIKGNEAEISIAGSGDVQMGGELKSELEINIAGSGDVETSALKCQKVEVNIAGSGDARVWAEDELESNIVGSGNVYYKGQPLVDAETTGSGSTKPL